MSNDDIRIEEFILQVPGYCKEDGRNLGEDVARRVADGLSVQNQNKHLGTLDLKITIPPGTSQSELAILVSEVILRGLM